MDKNALREQTLALAGLCQALHLVDSIARTGSAEPAPLEACFRSLFAFSANSVEEAYGGVQALELGLRELNDLLGQRHSDGDREVIRYIIGIMHLQRQLEKSPDTGAIIRSRLAHAEKAIDVNRSDISDLAPAIAAVYKDTISQFRFRLKVNGNAQHLQNEHNADRIRALLLAAIRATYLWRQQGGRRLHMLFRRGRILETARKLISTEVLH